MQFGKKWKKPQPSANNAAQTPNKFNQTVGSGRHGVEIFIHVFFDLRNRLCAVRPNALKELKMKKRSATHHGIFSQPGELWHNRGPFDTIIRHDRKHPPVDEPELIATTHLELRRYVFGFMLIGTTSRIKTLFIVRLILRPAYVRATLEAESF